MRSFLITLTLLAWMLTGYLPAQTGTGKDLSDPLMVTKISGGITFDGVPDEPSWQAVDALPFFQPEIPEQRGKNSDGHYSSEMDRGQNRAGNLSGRLP
jgi:hypothetical protein